MSALGSRKTYAALAAFQAGDAVSCAIPIPYIVTSLETLHVPLDVRWPLAAVKAASVVGLLSGSRFPALARLTTAALALYFVLAVGAHVRVRDRVVNAVPSASFLVTYAAMTVKGPDSE
jgi:hypothetical protein